MFCAGGLCFVLIDKMQEKLAQEVPFWARCTVGSLIITGVEFFIGCIVNLWAHCNVWDYSHMRHQLLGQICFRASVIWVFLAAIAIGASNFLRRRIRFLFPQEEEETQWKGEYHGEMYEMRPGHLRGLDLPHWGKGLLRRMRGTNPAAIRLFQRFWLRRPVYQQRRVKIS